MEEDARKIVGRRRVSALAKHRLVPCADPIGSTHRVLTGRFGEGHRAASARLDRPKRAEGVI